MPIADHSHCPLARSHTIVGLRAPALTMAFRRTDVNIPKQVTFPESLSKLGFTITPAGLVVDKATGKFFEFQKYAEHTINQQRYNAIHKAVRKKVYGALSVKGVTDLFFAEDPNTDSQSAVHEKPAFPSIRILSSPLGDLTKCKELYLVVGDSKEDLGVFSRKAMMREEGLFHGTVLGLVEIVRGAAVPGGSEVDDEAKIPESDLPGVVILNPGETLWSPKEKECMTAVTWADRERANGFSVSYKVTNPFNRISGHENAERHVKHCLYSFLNYAVAPTTRINIIALGDASQHVLAYLNTVYNNEGEKAKLADMEINIAMISPTHNDDDVTNPALKQFLANHGRIWESHSRPKGTLLANVAPEFRPLALTPATKQVDNETLVSGDNESDSEHDYPPTPPGEYTQRNNPIDYFRGPGLTMPLRKRLPVAEEPKADDEKGVAEPELSIALAQASLRESLCQKFSVGFEDTSDMIASKVMGDVLRFFEEKRDT